MSTSDYALFVSLISILISIGALVWNVWQKFIFVKPVLHVSFDLMNILQPASDGYAHPTGQKLLNLTVTNMGPGTAVLSSCIARARRKRPDGKRYGVLNPIHGDPTAAVPISQGPFSGGLPVKIDSGDTKSLYFPYANDIFLADGIERVGVNDTYHRNTWCARGDMKKVNEAYSRDFHEGWKGDHGSNVSG